MLKIRPLQETDLEKVRAFTDREIGAGYYTQDEVRSIFERSQKNQVMHSLVLSDEQDTIHAVRITYPPGQWEKGKGYGLSPEKWPHLPEHTAYFQSIFISSALQGEGWGGKLSHEALKILSETGARGVVCHSWKESPNNSSTRYLQKLGFQIINEYPNYWKDVNYICSGCKQKPCVCTSVEMYLDLEGDPNSRGR